MEKTRVHYLVPDLKFSKNVSFTNNLEHLIENARILILAIPSQSIRGVIEPYKHLISKNKIIVNLAKGIETNSLFTISSVLTDILGENFDNIVALSGPSHAEEVVLGHPTTLVSASKNQESASIIQKLFSNSTLRTYKSDDILGVELGGAMKNVIAIAAGICDGIGYGDNSKAALLTRGMGEITKLGKAMGADSSTFQGLSGFGDLIVTCLSKHSRNRKVGQAIGEGKSLKKVLDDMPMVAEGVLTAKSIHRLQLKHNVEMPIHEAIYNVLFNGENPKECVQSLMTRSLTDEHKEVI
jgi:glycerol-3-phosphate dehydrogenase (NAD(P)+)